MSSPWQKFATISSNLKALAMRMCSPTLLEPRFRTLPSNVLDVVPLSFPEIPSSLPQLLDLGLSQDCANLLHSQFLDAIRQADQTLSEIYYTYAPKFLEEDTTPPAVTSRSTYMRVIQVHLLTIRTQTIARLWSALLSQAQNLVNDAQVIQTNAQVNGTPPTIDCAPSNKRKRQGRPLTFTPEQTFALNSLLAREDQYSSQEKDLIAQKLNLTREQVNRWFCNARARKNTGSRSAAVRSISPASMRTVSSDISSDAITPEVSSSTPGVNNSSPELFSVPTNSASTNSTPVLHHLSSGSNDQTPEVDSLEIYLNYSACLEPEQGPSDLTHNSATQQDQGSFTSHITSWSENVNMTIPALSSSSSVTPKVFTTTDSMGATLSPQSQDCLCDTPPCDDQSDDPLDLISIQPIPHDLSSTPESPLCNDLFPDFDLSKW